MKNRIEVLDFAKGLAIFLVIMGHATDNLATPLWRLIIYSFHMPLFFLVAGMVVKPVDVTERGSLIDFLRKNFLALVVPFVIWGLLYSCFSYENFGNILYGTYEMLSKSHSLTSLWFLPALFLARQWVEILFRGIGKIKSGKNWAIGIAAVLFFLVGLLLPHPHPSTGTFIGYPFGFDISLVAAGYILVGYLLLPVVKMIKDANIMISIMGVLISLGILMCGTVLRADSLGLSAMAFNNYGSIPFMFINAFSGSAVIIFLSIILYQCSGWESRLFNKDILLFIGQNTIGIYLLHKNFMQEVVMALFTKLGWTEPQALVAFVSATITLIVACVAVKIINRYVPQLMGRFPSDKLMAVKE
ncbi:MAG: acyltransferase family protein [Paludibacteraceae bacterium]|nr:acyltransferase family protein [Paludibacteraceae bacterium]MBO7367609.1 acyltransferase family protein [Paludibacteraceae bacterium]